MINKQLLLSITDKYFEDVKSIPFSHQEIKQFIDYLYDGLQKVENVEKAAKNFRKQMDIAATNALLTQEKLKAELEEVQGMCTHPDRTVGVCNICGWSTV